MTDLTRWFEKVSRNEEAIKWIYRSEDRHTAAVKELLDGYNINPLELLLTVEPTVYEGLVGMKNISYGSICKHHFFPFEGTLDLVYEPGKGLFGAGKLPRVVDAYARRAQLQEGILRDVAEALVSAGAKGAYVRATGKHTCISCRGPKKPEATMIVSYATGSLQDINRLPEIRLLLEQ